MKATDGGTVTGRFSSSRPNLQNIPSRGQLGKLCRSLFLPEEGELFGSLDYSQIEYRILCHYARGDSGEIKKGIWNAVFRQWKPIAWLVGTLFSLVIGSTLIEYRIVSQDMNNKMGRLIEAYEAKN